MLTFPIYEKTESYVSLKYQLDLIFYLNPPLLKSQDIFTVSKCDNRQKKHTLSLYEINTFVVLLRI